MLHCISAGASDVIVRLWKHSPDDPLRNRYERRAHYEHRLDLRLRHEIGPPGCAPDIVLRANFREDVKVTPISMHPWDTNARVTRPTWRSPRMTDVR